MVLCSKISVIDEEGSVKTDKIEKDHPFEKIFVKWFLLNDPIWSSKVDHFSKTGAVF